MWHGLPPSAAICRPIALAGDHVCARAGHVFVNGVAVARVLNHDRQGRPLVPWRGCRTLVDGEMFVLSTHHAASFDSRYFGPIPRTATVGMAVPIRTWSAR
nr:S26 family signal peptidase [Alcaligenes faecalis]